MSKSKKIILVVLGILAVISVTVCATTLVVMKQTEKQLTSVSNRGDADAILTSLPNVEDFVDVTGELSENTINSQEKESPAESTDKAETEQKEVATPEPTPEPTEEPVVEETSQNPVQPISTPIPNLENTIYGSDITLYADMDEDSLDIAKILPDTMAMETLLRSAGEDIQKISDLEIYGCIGSGFSAKYIFKFSNTDAVCSIDVRGNDVASYEGFYNLYDKSYHLIYFTNGVPKDAWRIYRAMDKYEADLWSQTDFVDGDSIADIASIPDDGFHRRLETEELYE